MTKRKLRDVLAPQTFYELRHHTPPPRTPKSPERWAHRAPSDPVGTPTGTGSTGAASLRPRCAYVNRRRNAVAHFYRGSVPAHRSLRGLLMQSMPRDRIERRAVTGRGSASPSPGRPIPPAPPVLPGSQRHGATKSGSARHGLQPGRSSPVDLVRSEGGRIASASWSRLA